MRGRRSNSMSMQRCSVCQELGHKATRHRTNKVCISCGKNLPIDQFYQVHKQPGSLVTNPSSRCKTCDVAASNAAYRSGFRGRLLRLLNSAKTRSKSEGWIFDIDIDYLLTQLDLQSYLCYYTGEPLTFETGDSGVSLDRKDSGCGYVKGNVVLVSWRINNMKGNLSEIEFIKMCQLVSRRT
jgi:hypothetical protein